MSQAEDPSNGSFEAACGVVLSDSDDGRVRAALENLVVKLRDDANRALVTQPILNRICQLYSRSDSRDVQLLALRAVANAVAYCEQNRYFLVENLDFIRAIAQKIAVCEDIQEVNYAMTVLYNFSNDFEPGVKILVAEDQLPNALSTSMAKHWRNGDGDQQPPFLTHVAVGLLELFLHHPEKISSSTTDILLEISTQLLEDDPDTEDVEPVALLMRIIEASQEFENSFVQNHKFEPLLDVALKTFDREEVRQHSLSALGNISSLPGFQLQIDSSNKLFQKVASMVHDPKSMMVACGACILGNLATTKENVNELVQIVPDIVPCVTRMLADTKNPFEMQAAHLIKNLSLVPEVKQTVSEPNLVTIIEKMLWVAIFPQIRLIAVQLSRGFLANVNVVELLASRFAKEDDDSVKSAIFMAMTQAVETMIENNKSSHLSLPLNVLQNVDQMLQQPQDKWNATALLKATKAIGVVSVRQPQELEDFPLERLLESSDQLKDSTDPLYQGVVKNLGFIAANISKINFKDDLTEACDTAIANCK